MNPKVTILIGTRQRLEFLKRCLQSLECLPLGFAEIVVIDAASTDGTREFLESKSYIKTIFEEVPSGQASGLNQGARLGVAPYICWLSDDNRLRPRTLESAVEILDEDSAIGLVGLRVKDTCEDFACHPFIGGVSDAGVITCNQGLIRRDIFDQVGGFDEELRDYLIDSDLPTKVLLAGYHVVHLRRIAVEHDRERSDGSWMSVEKRKAQTKRNTDIYNERYHSLVRGAFTDLKKRGKCITSFLWKALFKYELDSHRSRSSIWLPEFYRSYVLFAKSCFVTAEDICPNNEKWSLRQIYRTPIIDEQAKVLSLHQIAALRRHELRETMGSFEALGYLHAKSKKLTRGLLRYLVIKFVSLFSEDKPRFRYFVLWFSGLPKSLAILVADACYRQRPPKKRPHPKISATIVSKELPPPASENEGSRQGA